MCFLMGVPMSIKLCTNIIAHTAIILHSDQNVYLQQNFVQVATKYKMKNVKSAADLAKIALGVGFC